MWSFILSARRFAQKVASLVRARYGRTLCRGRLRANDIKVKVLRQRAEYRLVEPTSTLFCAFNGSYSPLRQDHREHLHALAKRFEREHNCERLLAGLFAYKLCGIYNKQ